MFYIVLAILLFIASVTTHIVYCRHTTKKGLQAKFFIMTAILFWCVYGGIVFSLQHMGILDEHSLWGLPFRITAGFIYILLIPMYLSFYVLTQLTSPSKMILVAIAGKGELTYKDIVLAIKKEDFIGSRLQDLCMSGCVRHLDGQYILTNNGKKIANLLNFMQLILGRNVGG